MKSLWCVTWRDLFGPHKLFILAECLSDAALMFERYLLRINEEADEVVISHAGDFLRESD